MMAVQAAHLDDDLKKWICEFKPHDDDYVIGVRATGADRKACKDEELGPVFEPGQVERDDCPALDAKHLLSVCPL
jgi:hypothetical protein